MKDFRTFFDSWGLLGQKDLYTSYIEGGDSAQRTGMYLTALKLLGAVTDHLDRPLNQAYEAMMNKHELKGILRRHPDKKYWYSDPRNCSRDQQVSLVVAMGLFGDKTRLKSILLKHLLRCGFYQNVQHNGDPGFNKPIKEWRDGWKLPDIITPVEIGSYVRAFKFWPAYPLLFFTDFFLAISVIIRCIQAKHYDDVGDDLNVLIHITQSHFVLPTLISKLAKKIYFKFRPRFEIIRLPSAELIAKPNKDTIGPQYALDWYFRDIFSPPINDLWRPLILLIK